MSDFSKLVNHLAQNPSHIDLEINYEDDWMPYQLASQAQAKLFFFAKTAAGSRYATWGQRGKQAPGAIDESLPIAYLSHEGAPIGVVAEKFREFLALLHYGAVEANILLDMQFFAEDAANCEDPVLYYSPEYLEGRIERTKEDYDPEYSQFRAWLKDALGCSELPAPAARIAALAKTWPNFRSQVLAS